MLQTERPDLYSTSITPKWAGEAPPAAVFCKQFEHTMRHIAVDKLRRVSPDAPLEEGTTVYRYGGALGDQYTEPSLLVTFPGRYLSDGVQQVEVCGRKEGHPLANDRHTLDHRAQIPAAGMPTLHHSRLYRQSHLLAARRHMEAWTGIHGHVGAVEACCKVLGIGRHPPPYGTWPVDLQASTEVCHCVHLGIGLRTAELELHCLVAQDKPLVRPAAPAPSSSSATGGGNRRFRSARGNCWRRSFRACRIWARAAWSRGWR